MKIIRYTDVDVTHFDNDLAKGVDGRVLIGRKDGANNFCMRIFEIAPGGHTPKHSHNWEHEMFIHAGAGDIYCKGIWNSVESGYVIFVPANEEHQVRNSGQQLLKIICLVPPEAPEL